jgi:hypothetical protein
MRQVWPPLSGKYDLKSGGRGHLKGIWNQTSMAIFEGTIYYHDSHPETEEIVERLQSKYQVHRSAARRFANLFGYFVRIKVKLPLCLLKHYAVKT